MAVDISKLPDYLRRIAEAALADKSGCRNSGRTLRMVLNMREDSWIIVHNDVMRQYVVRAIATFRPDLSIDRATRRVIVIADRRDVHKLAGLRGFLDIDHAVSEHIDRETDHAITLIWGGLG